MDKGVVVVEALFVGVGFLLMQAMRAYYRAAWFNISSFKKFLLQIKNSIP